VVFTQFTAGDLRPDFYEMKPGRDDPDRTPGGGKNLLIEIYVKAARLKMKIVIKSTTHGMLQICRKQ
jgi:hypothetical protein